MRDEPPTPFSFVEIMPGSIIIVNVEVLKSGFVDVMYDGQIFGAFMRDVEARADMVASLS